MVVGSWVTESAASQSPVVVVPVKFRRHTRGMVSERLEGGLEAGCFRPMGGLCASWVWARAPLCGRLGTGAPARVSVAWRGFSACEREGTSDLGGTMGRTRGWGDRERHLPGCGLVDGPVVQPARLPPGGGSGQNLD